ncbi:MAG: hypothetical protein J4F41_06365 [Alphaproteobacteria bacterium]|nr:hypothetical protein [Alphaproteobacteria bacterium]
MDKNTKLAIKRMRDIQKIRAGYSKKLVMIEQNLTKIGWEIMVGDAAEGDDAMEKAVKAVDGAIGNLQEALNALGRVEPGIKTSAMPTSAPITSKPSKGAKAAE